MKPILVTGSAGFIGFAVSKILLERGDYVVGIDNHNNYYDPKIKEFRVEELKKYSNYNHNKADLNDKKILEELFYKHKLKVVNFSSSSGGALFHRKSFCIYP